MSSLAFLIIANGYLAVLTRDNPVVLVINMFLYLLLAGISTYLEYKERKTEAITLLDKP